MRPASIFSNIQLSNFRVLEDTNLFVKGEGWEGFDKEMVMFPTLSHA